MTDSTASSHPRVISHNDARLTAALQRLDRLEGFLREDPSNDLLLIDAFETALSCGEWERARAHLQSGQAHSPEPLAWRLREGDFWLAQQRYEEALGVLEALQKAPQPPAGFAEVLLHNLAFIEFRRGRLADCVNRLASTLEAPAVSDIDTASPPATRALQQLWLRAMHHDGQLDRALAWTRAAEQRRALAAQAAGVASLIAIDASDFAAAQRWSSVSLSSGASADHPVEALIAQASLALAARDATLAARLADVALQRQPGDGRAWSTRGFAALLAVDLAGARDAFERAVTAMASHIGTWHGLGWTQILQGDLAGARMSFDAALALDRNFAESHGGLAVVLAMQSSTQEAKSHAELALRLDRSNLSGRYAQALLSGEVKDASDVQRLAQRLFGGRAAPLGGDMADLFQPPVDGAG
ncbi:tetratricopeptide (TPR) repeat protein [Variovorax boronicumulans]|uniref:tetratricopeptide repeat protein n=1 Tax=Variovorax boronicumulans TaxID=436515 RepID=UPI0027866F8C|nr:tetratricopeptide repeat protein [Variovorax boronicumulans]MDP9912420.1 tetratricopeptide (TPR) repeat protein [Variovorax boronicumulans]